MLTPNVQPSPTRQDRNSSCRMSKSDASARRPYSMNSLSEASDADIKDYTFQGFRHTL